VKEKKRRRRKVRSDKITFTKKEISDIEGFAAIGLTQEQICHVLGVSPDTLQRRVKEGDTRITDAILRGKSLAIGNVAKKAYESAMGGNTAMIKYFLAIHNNWHEKPVVNNCGGPPQENNSYQNAVDEFDELLDAMTDEELDKYGVLLEEQIKLRKTVEARVSPQNKS
jgi:predicted DNA-binding protein (UPF0251 family)